MERTNPTPTRRKKKTLNACQRCRSRKIKCSGQDPCQHCTSRRADCAFEERTKKLLVSEDYLQQLQNRASVRVLQRLPTPSATLTSTISVPSSNGERNNHLLNSPRVGSVISPVHEQHQHILQPSEPPISTSVSTYGPGFHTCRPGPDRMGEREGLNNQQGSADAIGDEYRRLGHSSSWSFSRRVRCLINDHTRGSGLHDVIVIQDGAYGVPWRKNVLDLSGLDLPKEDYAEYLTNTLVFNLGQLYYLFDKAAFLAKLHLFYADENAAKEHSTDMWHIQMLVVFAFGKSILARGAGPSGPTGAAYFARAVEALPDNHRLYEQPILSIEILCMLALFMQAMDMRLAAHEYIGQALRIGLVQGLNRRFDAKRITMKEFEHRSNLWWTIYIIERKLSSLVGVPAALHDEDIALPRPSIDPAYNQTISIALHVELSSQLGKILDVVYGLGIQRELGGKFSAAIQLILRRLADTSVVLNTSMKIELQRPTDTISRVAASLHLLHHQCSILTIRPVLFFLLQKKLATSSSSFILSDAVIGLLRVCVESAVQILKIVEGLRSHNLVDLLLPFDLDAMFAGAFVLLMVDIITPAATEQWDLSKTFALMEEMTVRGIIIAEPYRKDLYELNELRQKLRINPQRQLSEQQLQSPAYRSEIQSLGANVEDVPAQPCPQPEQDMIWLWNAADDNELGVIDPEIIQSAIDGLNFDFLNDPSAIELGGIEWMWSSVLHDGSNLPKDG